MTCIPFTNLLIAFDRELFVRILTDFSEIFDLINFYLILCMQGGLICSMLDDFPSVSGEILVSSWKVKT